MRYLNSKTQPSNLRLPQIHECLDLLAQRRPTCFTTLDLRHGFWQVGIVPRDQHKTAFWVEGLGQMAWTRGVMGLSYLPATFQRIMERILRNLIAENKLLVYLDDILIYSRSHEEMLDTLKAALQLLKEAGLLINAAKCEFGVETLTYLGFEISGKGYRPDPAKTFAILNCQVPKTLKGVRSFIGMIQFYRNHFPEFSELIKPLSRLTSARSGWSGGVLKGEALATFEKCKALLAKRPVLAYPDMNLKMHLFVDGSLGEVDNEDSGGLSACLIQFEGDDVSKPPRCLGFASRTLLKHERNYSAFLVENAAAVFGIEHFSKYLEGRPFVLYTDHKPMVAGAGLSNTHKRTLERLREMLAQYDFEMQYFPGKDHPSDFLSRYGFRSIRK